MRFLMVLAFGLCLSVAGPAAAQDRDTARRLVLAEQYIALTRGPSLKKTLESYFEETFAKFGGPGRAARLAGRKHGGRFRGGD